MIISMNMPTTTRIKSTPMSTFTMQNTSMDISAATKAVVIYRNIFFRRGNRTLILIACFRIFAQVIPQWQFKALDLLGSLIVYSDHLLCLYKDLDRSEWMVLFINHKNLLSILYSGI
jgi:hypothetical protein